MFESRCENKDFVNFIFKSVAINAVRLMKYEEFVISCYGHQVEMFESAYNNMGLVNCIFK